MRPNRACPAAETLAETNLVILLSAIGPVAVSEHVLHPGLGLGFEVGLGLARPRQKSCPIVPGLVDPPVGKQMSAVACPKGKPD